MGLTYAAMERKEDTLAALKEGIKVAPDHIELYYTLGRFYVQVGDKKAPKQEYEILKQAAPTLAESLLKMIDQ